MIERLSLAGEGRRGQLLTTYFDTPAGDLTRAGMVLRVRDDGRRRFQTIKAAAAGALRRHEWETDVAGDTPDLGLARQTPLKSLLTGEVCAALRPAFVVEVERLKRDVKAGGATLEIALDRGEVRAGERRAPIHELELELKRGAPAALFAYAEALAAEFPIHLSFITKAERGRALTDLATVPIKPLAAEADAASAFVAIAAGALVQAVGSLGRFRHAQAAEDLHQTRVGLRRLRSAMLLFRPMLAGDAFDAVKAELKWLAKATDDARDLDVFLQALQAPADGLTERHAALVERLQTARAAAYGRALAAAGSPRGRIGPIRALGWIEAGDWLDDPAAHARRLRARPVRALAGELLAQRLRRVLRTGEHLKSLDIAARHKLRISTKKLRYACGFFADLYGARAKDEFPAAAAHLQDALGALTDLDASQTLLARVSVLLGDGESAPAFAITPPVDEAQALVAACQALDRLQAAEPFW